VAADRRSCARAGTGFSLEDAACAGALIRRLHDAAPDLELNDAAAFASDFDAAMGASPEAILRRCEHGRYLAGLGFEEDLPVCAAVDTVPVVPHLKEGRIMGAPLPEGTKRRATATTPDP
jgi:phosphosulfolactate phosphohydrolase-like enzyme